jgi:hypothetical protein
MCSVNEIAPDAKKLLRYHDIPGFAARALSSVAEALEYIAAILASVALGKDLFYAAEVDSATAGGAHVSHLCIFIINNLL